MTIEGIEGSDESGGQRQRIKSFCFASAFLGHFGTNVFPKVSVLGHIRARDVIGNGDAGELDDAAFDGVPG